MDSSGPALDRAALTPVVRRALGSSALEVDAWQARALGTTMSGSGLYCVHGTARDRGSPAPWSLVLKVADAWGGCIAAMLAGDRPTIRAVNPTTWIKQTNYRDTEFGPPLRAVADQRAGLLAVLEPLSPEDWARGDGDGGRGTRERTVLSYARWLANHERSHDKQIARVAAAVRGQAQTHRPGLKT